MAEALLLLVAAVLAAIVAGTITVIAGIKMGRNMERIGRTEPPVENECGCKHHLSFHNPDTGQCRKEVDYDYDNKDRRIPVLCECQQFAPKSGKRSAVIRSISPYMEQARRELDELERREY